MDLLEQRDSLSPEQIQFVGRWLRREHISVLPRLTVQRPAPAKAPLTRAQERLWFLEQLVPHNLAYRRCVAARLVGELDIGRFVRSLAAVVERHAVLQSTFHDEGGVLSQVHASSGMPRVSLIDLGMLSPQARARVMPSLVPQCLALPMDVRLGPLVHGCLVRFAPDEHVVVLVVHAIVCDGESGAVVLRDLAMAYGADEGVGSAVLPELPVQYADVARWQGQWLQDGSLDGQLDYWRQQLAGLPVLEVPTDRPRPALPSGAGAQHTFRLSQALTVGLQTLSDQEEVTLFMTLLAAFQVLLMRYSRQEDIVVGTLVMGRAQRVMRDLVGVFENALVLRGDLHGNPSFRALVRRVRMVCLGAYANQDVPFERLLDVLQPERDASRSPLFQVMLVFQQGPPGVLTMPGLVWTPLLVQTQMTRFDLTLTFSEVDRQLQGVWEYATDLFDAATIARMSAQFQVLLAGVVADADGGVWQLPLMTAEERLRLLTDWNATKIEYLHDVTLPELVVAQALRTPDAIAAVYDDQHLSYEDLVARARYLALYLDALGVAPDVRVGVCLPRTLDLVIGLLGVLQAGGAYVPLDPAAPADRRAFILADSEAAVLLTTMAYSDVVPSSSMQVCWLDLLPPPDPADGDAPTAFRLYPEHLAYVLSTSGSTGLPKGVAVTHRGAVALLRWAQMVFTPAEFAGMLASTPILFDLSVFELFAPLSVGGTVILADDALALPRLLAASAVTFINTVPSMLAEVLRLGALPPGVQTIALAGEPLPRALARELGSFPVVLYNLYGPSEDTTYSTWARIVRGGPITIGRPLVNTQVYVLDRYAQPVPIGVPGELYVGGSGLARGYLNRPDVTAARFLPNPFAGMGKEGQGAQGFDASDVSVLPHDFFSLPSSRLYRTGDVVRWRADGQLEFLGRCDSQVKLRGFRIELGEIEHVLRRHDAVRDAVVIVREDRPGDQRLVAYVVLGPMSMGMDAPTAAQLRAFLGRQLPEYMLPSAFVVLERLPLTLPGKVDRRALPAPEVVLARATHDQPPQDVVEVRLVGLWEMVFQHHPIGVHDSFFDLGGQSLLALQLLAEVRQVFGRVVPLALFFREPTIAQLAVYLR